VSVPGLDELVARVLGRVADSAEPYPFGAWLDRFDARVWNTVMGTSRFRRGQVQLGPEDTAVVFERLCDFALSDGLPSGPRAVAWKWLVDMAYTFGVAVTYADVV
jgi:hypothetical protein